MNHWITHRKACVLVILGWEGIQILVKKRLFYLAHQLSNIFASLKKASLGSKGITNSKQCIRFNAGMPFMVVHKCYSVNLWGRRGRRIYSVSLWLFHFPLPLHYKRTSITWVMQSFINNLMQKASVVRSAFGVALFSLLPSNHFPLERQSGLSLRDRDWAFPMATFKGK